MRAGVALVATNNVHYATPREFRRANVLAAIRARRSLEEMEGWLSASPLAHLRSDAEQRRRFARWPGVVDRAGELVGELAFDLRLVAPNLPAFATPPGHDEQSYLEELVARGAADRYGPRERERVAGAWRQIDHELGVIKTLGFAGYFLTVWDITEFCRRQRHLLSGPGLGGELGGVLLARHHQRRRGVAQPPLRALLVAGARRPPRHRRGHRVRSARGGHPVRLRALRTPPRRPGRRGDHVPLASALRDVARAFGASEEEANYIRDHWTARR